MEKTERPRFKYFCTNCEVPLTKEERCFPDRRNLVGCPPYCETCVTAVGREAIRWSSGSGERPPRIR